MIPYIIVERRVSALVSFSKSLQYIEVELLLLSGNSGFEEGVGYPILKMSFILCLLFILSAVSLNRSFPPFPHRDVINSNDPVKLIDMIQQELKIAGGHFDHLAVCVLPYLSRSQSEKIIAHCREFGKIFPSSAMLTVCAAVDYIHSAYKPPDEDAARKLLSVIKEVATGMRRQLIDDIARTATKRIGSNAIPMLYGHCLRIVGSEGSAASALLAACSTVQHMYGVMVDHVKKTIAANEMAFEKRQRAAAKNSPTGSDGQ